MWNFATAPTIASHSSLRQHNSAPLSSVCGLRRQLEICHRCSWLAANRRVCPKHERQRGKLEDSFYQFQCCWGFFYCKLLRNLLFDSLHNLQRKLFFYTGCYGEQSRAGAVLPATVVVFALRLTCRCQPSATELFRRLQQDTAGKVCCGMTCLSSCLLQSPEDLR